ncbi:MAG: very short patch repair endonuclease [Alphaproteobacteria bacterium]
MADSRTPEQRRRIMRAVRSTNTMPEWKVRRLLFAMGYRYRIHYRKLPGSPDIAFPGRRKAIFVHGCFWHSHGCRIGRPPKSRLDYWLPKLARNAERDRAKIEAIEAQGWRALVIWQCQLVETDALQETLRDFLDDS